MRDTLSIISCVLLVMMTVTILEQGKMLEQSEDRFDSLYNHMIIIVNTCGQR